MLLGGVYISYLLTFEVMLMAALFHNFVAAFMFRSYLLVFIVNFSLRQAILHDTTAWTTYFSVGL